MLSPFKKKFKLTSPRGSRTIFGKKEFHKGIDLVGINDETIYAVASGTVFTLYEKNGFGNYIRQHLPDGRRIYYAHMKSFLVNNQTFVNAGEKIGIMGATGRVTGPHLHLELRPAGYGSESLDITEFCDIPNKVGTYGEEQNLSSDKTINSLMKYGIISEENRKSWEMMLSGKAPLVAEYVRTIFERCCEKIQSNQN